jgi:phospholipid/cholesterol/gamma-HCH transport system substrate-binding protein
MTERVRNMAVGLTVILALCGLCGMIILFGKAPAFARGGYLLTINLPAAGGVGTGSEVQLNDITIGRVTSVNLPTDPRQGVQVYGRINHSRLIPQNVSATVGSRGLGGSAYIKMYPSSGGPGQGYLPTDGTATIQGQLTPYGGLLGSETSMDLGKIAESFQTFSRLADNLNDVLLGKVSATAPGGLATATASAPATGGAGGEGLANAIIKLNRILDGLGSVVNSQDNQTNLQASLANLRKTTEQAAATMGKIQKFAQEATSTAQRTGQRVDELAVQLNDDAARLAKLLTALNQVADKLARGEGTAGKLINDPALYNELVDSVRQLSKTLSELQATLRTWREKGVDINIF